METYNNNENYRVRGFQFLPPIIKNLLIINVLFYLADMTLGARGIDLSRYLVYILFQLI